MDDKKTWPLWECLSEKSLANWNKLRKRYGLKAKTAKEIESLEEIDRLMRQPPHYEGKSSD